VVKILISSHEFLQSARRARVGTTAATQLQIDFEVEGIVRDYNPTRGHRSFGFITPQGNELSEDIFVDAKCVKESGLESLPKGAKVLCKGFVRDKGPKARRVEIIS